jgi:hypothetical protein
MLGARRGNTTAPVHCAGMMSSAVVLLKNIPGIVNAIPGSGENRSPSRRNRRSPSPGIRTNAVGAGIWKPASRHRGGKWESTSTCQRALRVKAEARDADPE